MRYLPSLCPASDPGRNPWPTRATPKLALTGRWFRQQCPAKEICAESAARLPSPLSPLVFSWLAEPVLHELWISYAMSCRLRFFNVFGQARALPITAAKVTDDDRCARSLGR
jgi:hypothetical protein